MGELAAVERVRVELLCASDLDGAGRVQRARPHLLRARTLYANGLSRGVRARDRELDREIRAAFDGIDADVDRRAPPPAVSDRVGALSGQLLDAAEELLVPAAARLDAGARAQVLARLLAELDRVYRRGVDGRVQADVERAYGLLARSQALARGLGPTLGPRRDPVLLALSTLRTRAYPVGILRPPSAAPPDEVDTRVRRVQALLRERYRLG